MKKKNRLSPGTINLLFPQVQSLAERQTVNSRCNRRKFPLHLTVEKRVRVNVQDSFIFKLSSGQHLIKNENSPTNRRVDFPLL